MFKKAVLIGAGNIGRGLNAYIVYKNKYHLTFIDSSIEIIQNLQKTNQYKIIEVHSNKTNKHSIQNFKAMHINQDEEECIEEIANATLVLISIGTHNLNNIVKLVAKSIVKKMNSKNKEFLNFVAVENGIEISSSFKNDILGELTQKQQMFVKEKIGFPNCSVDRIVPKQMHKSLDIYVEPFYELIIDKSSWKGDLIHDVKYSCNLKKYIKRKLFMLNAIHTLIAWYGIKHNFKYIHEFAARTKIKWIVQNTLKEFAAILETQFNFTKEELENYSQKIIQRLSNVYLADDVTRVGRNVIKKLSPNDRLVLPLNYALQNNLNYENIIKIIALPFSGLNFEDEQLKKLNNFLKKNGLEVSITKYTGIKNAKIIQQIKNNLSQI